MSTVYADAWLTLHQGDACEVLRSLPAESVQCVVTSPPYWGLRDYGVSGQLGLEPIPEAYVAGMVAVFAEVRRVLRRDGVCWVNLGDSYARDPGRGVKFQSGETTYLRNQQADEGNRGPAVPLGCKEKDLVGIPWMLAFALRADGWYLRSDVIWSKPNPMPESVTDRPTKAHEYLFLLTRSARYFYDAEAVREADGGKDAGNGFVRPQRISGGLAGGNPEQWTAGAGRNLRSVWSIATEPYPEAHFATFPQKLVEPCIKAGTSERGACPECGAPWVRETAGGGGTYDERKALGYDQPANMKLGVHPGSHRGIHPPGFTHTLTPVTRETTGWRPTCRHYPRTAEWPSIPVQLKSETDEHYADRIAPALTLRAELLTLWRPLASVPCVVLDPFLGSGTVALVAERLGRRTVGIELNPEYVQQALARVAEGRCEGTGAPLDLPLPAPDGSLWDVPA